MASPNQMLLQAYTARLPTEWLFAFPPANFLMLGLLTDEGGNMELLKGSAIIFRYLLKPHPVQTILSLQFVLSMMMMIEWKYTPFERVNKYKGKSFPSSRRTHQLHFDNNHQVDSRVDL